MEPVLNCCQLFLLSLVTVEHYQNLIFFFHQLQKGPHHPLNNSLPPPVAVSLAINLSLTVNR